MVVCLVELWRGGRVPGMYGQPRDLGADKGCGSSRCVLMLCRIQAPDRLSNGDIWGGD